MAYTIQVLNGINLPLLQHWLLEAIKKDGRFTVGRSDCEVSGSRKPKHMIKMERIRLTTGKPYCGNHPGPCIVSPFGGVQKKKTTKYLEWEDWVALHGLVNDVLDKHKVSADVFTKPQDARGKFYMRRGLARRVHYEYDEDWSRGGFRPVLIWNLGTPDQFAEPIDP